VTDVTWRQPGDGVATRPVTGGLASAPAERFRRRARSAPDALALVDDELALTYRELDVFTDALAGQLGARGIGPERVVAVRVDRKLEAAAALLAVLKAGGVYLPLEAGAPAARQRMVLADSGAALLFVGSGVAHADLDIDKLFWQPPVSVGWAAPAERHRITPDNATVPGNAAYVLYTSGTTGRPKGVCVARDLLGEQLDAVTAGFGLRPDDRILQFSPMHVDTAIEQALSALTLGAALVVIDETLSVKDMVDFLARHRVTVAHLATGYWHAIANSLEWRAWPDIPLRTMIVGGDRMSAKAAMLWRRHARVPLINAYGPTETVITPTICRVSGIDEQSGAPLGDPIGDRVAYVLDDDMRPCPADTPGELYLGGRLLARGYVGRPGVTARAFTADPFSGVPGARLYRTGDLVRRTAAGDLYFLGRKDGQLKFRGHRIELGEIEVVLATDPTIREVAVVVREDREGDQRLVAYVVPAGREADGAAWRSRAAQRLPAHMVPSVFVPLAALPLNSNSKVDRRALLGPAFRPVDRRQRQVAR
jgi:amino acid adenylation domain-containing protein